MININTINKENVDVRGARTPRCEDCLNWRDNGGGCVIIQSFGNVRFEDGWCSEYTGELSNGAYMVGGK